jgi:hypothetical protein
MATLDDVSQLTAERFRRMSPGNGPKLPPVDLTGLPPGPRWPVLVQTAGLLRFRHWFHPHLHKKYGDVFTIRLAPGGRPLVFFTRPEHAKEIFAGDPEVFHAGKPTRSSARSWASTPCFSRTPASTSALASC